MKRLFPRGNSRCSPGKQKTAGFKEASLQTVPVSAYPYCLQRIPRFFSFVKLMLNPVDFLICFMSLAARISISSFLAFSSAQRRRASVFNHLQLGFSMPSSRKDIKNYPFRVLCSRIVRGNYRKVASRAAISPISARFVVSGLPRRQKRDNPAFSKIRTLLNTFFNARECARSLSAP
jgi:hypothetical protein